MRFEALPNELFLAIFRYLHKFDLLVAFTNLNQRFQQIVEPYLNEIDLTHHRTPFYAQFQSFSQHVLPIYAHNIRSLKLVGYEQFHVFQLYIDQLTTLEQLVIEAERHRDYSNYGDKLNSFLLEALSSIESLEELSIYSHADLEMERIFAVANNLTRLTLIQGRTISTDFDNLMPLTSLKCLTLDCSSITYLAKLLQATPNLQELNLYMVRLHFIEKSVNILQIPETLRRLLLKVGGYRNRRIADRPHLEMVKTLLNIFEDPVHHLTLIAIDVNKQFSHFDQLQSLVQNFVHLQNFDYYIRTRYPPPASDIELFAHVEQHPDSSYSLSNTLHCRQPFRSEKITKGTYPILTLDKLYNCTKLFVDLNQDAPKAYDLRDAKFQLVNLRCIEFFNPMDENNGSFYQFIKNVIRLSSNLRCLIFEYFVDTNHLIKQLCHMFSSERRKRIRNFHLSTAPSGCERFHSTFWSELAGVLPNLRTLNLQCDLEFFYQSTSTLPELIQMLRKYFRQLTFLDIATDQFKKYDDEETHKRLEKWRKEFDEYVQHHARQKFAYSCTTRTSSSDHTWFEFWL